MLGWGGVVAAVGRSAPEGLADVVATWAPDVVAIDSPPHRGVRGRSRQAERDLVAAGIQVFFTPSDEEQWAGAFYDWMRTGERAFVAVAPAYPIYRGGDEVAGHAVEVFPHASAVTLRGRRWPTGTTRPSQRRRWRADVLADHGVDPAPLRTLDQVDAALAALTGLRALDGEFTAVGDHDEGVIVLPVRRLRLSYPREEALR